MPKPQQRRVLVTLDSKMINDLIEEGKAEGLKLATYVRRLLHTHPRRSGHAVASKR